MACVLALTGCAAAAETAPATQAAPTAVASPTRTYASIDPIPTINPHPTTPSWFDLEMTDVTTGKPFRIGDFSGKVVLVETMAQWCPTCQGEMSQVKRLHELLGPGTDLVSVALDVDPNEDAATLKKYAAKNGFGWRIAVAPISVGRFLSMNYDEGYLNPPLLPMLFIDRAGGVYGLPFGIKSAESLKKTLEPFLKQ
jgi:thiol-disulfide isomerase/thioredoxin